MEKRSALAAGGVVATIVALFLVLRDEDRHAGRAQPKHRPTLQDAEPVRAPDTLASASAPVEEAATRVEPRSALEESAPAVPAPPAWSVRVVRAREPAVGAEVAWATRAELRAVEDARDAFEHAWVASAPLRASVRADAEGVVHLPPLEPGARVVARDGALIGMCVVYDTTHPPLEIVLVPDRDLDVRVTDPLGAPVGDVDVVVRIMSERAEHVMSKTTEADGLAHFWRLGLGWGIGESATGVVSVDGLFAAPPEAEFTVRAWPTAPLELVLPPHGSVRVDVLDGAGASVAESQRSVELSVQREDLPGAMVHRRRGILERDLEEGSALFQRVGLGLELVARLDDRPRHEPAEIAFHGPERHGGEVRARLELRESSVVLVVRVLAPDGEPLRDTQVEFTRTRRMDGASMSDGDRAKTDADGRVDVPLDEPWSEGTTLELELTHDGPDGTRASASLDLSRAFPPGKTDLGDVRLVALEPLVAGRVVDARGAGVYDARLRVKTAVESWRIHTTQPDGSFAIHTEPAVDRHELVVEADRFAPHPVIAFTAGTRDLVVTLADGAGLAGSVLLPDGFPPQAVRAIARFPAGERKAQVASDGRFALAGLPEEALAVELELVPGNVRVARIEDVAARVEGSGRDARLEALDLRDAVRALRIEVLLPDRTPARGGWVRDVRSAGRTGEAAFVIEGGAARLLVPAGPADVEVCVSGHRLLRVEGVDADRTVMLEPAFTVRCELLPDVSLPATGTLQLSLTPLAWGSLQNVTLFRGPDIVGFWSPALGDDSNTFDERRELLVPIQQAGPHAVRFHLIHGGPDGASVSFEIAPRAGLEHVEIDERSSGETLRVAPDEARYAELKGG